MKDLVRTSPRVERLAQKTYGFASRTVPAIVAKAIPGWIIERGLESFFAKIERTNNAFFTMHLRPKRAKDVARPSEAPTPKERIGIVLQGPLMLENGFTLETLRLYKKLHPSATIILSTWLGEDVHTLRAAREAGAIVLENTKPTFTGAVNMNLQIVSSIAGIRKAKELGCSYCIKTRTDQRAYATDLPSKLMATLSAFPLTKGWKQKERIVALSLDSFKYRLYGISDMFLFGHIDDMITYWTPPADTRKHPGIQATIGEYSRARITEVYFASHFLERVGRKIRWTLADSWDAYATHFCIIDDAVVDIYWPKYERRQEHRHIHYEGVHALERLDFAFWLVLQQKRIAAKDVPEERLTLPI